VPPTHSKPLKILVVHLPSPRPMPIPIRRVQRLPVILLAHPAAFIVLSQRHTSHIDILEFYPVTTHVNEERDVVLRVDVKESARLVADLVLLQVSAALSLQHLVFEEVLGGGFVA